MTNIKQYECIITSQPINVVQKVPTKFDLHWHHYNEILVYPSDATGKNPVILVDQSTYTLKPGDALLIWSSEMHAVVSNADCVLTAIQFPPSLLTDLPDFTPLSHLFRSYHHISMEDSQTVALAEFIQDKMQQIMEINRQKKAFSGVESLICLYELFMAFGMQLQQQLSNQDLLDAQGSSRTVEKISMACRYISENCEKDLSLDNMASMTGFSSCYFSRIFKQTMHQSFVEYLTQQRLKRAQTLLTGSDTPVTRIAMESGFKSISTFNRVFQKYKGCSPSEFKKHFQQ